MTLAQLPSLLAGGGLIAFSVLILLAPRLAADLLARLADHIDPQDTDPS